MADKIDLLFDDLQARGFAKDKTRDDFRKYMLAPGEQGYKNRKNFFEDFKSQGMTDLNTYEDFRDLLGLHTTNPATGKPVNAPSTQTPRNTKPQSIGYGALLRPGSSFIDQLNVERQNNFATQTAERIDRRSKRRNMPVADTGIESANRSVIKTQGQWEDELNAGVRNLGGFITPMVGEAVRKTDDLWMDIFTRANENLQGKPGAAISAMTQANEATDPEKVLESLKGNLQQILESPDMKRKIKEGADAAGISVDEYSQQMVAPALMERLVSEFDNSQIAKRLPRNTTEYILSGLNNSIIGMLASAATKTRSQRRYDLEAEAMTEQGQNQHYQPGTGANLTRIGVTFAADAPFFGLYGKVGGNVIKRVAERQIQNMMAKGLSDGAARSIVGAALEKSAGTRMKNYIMQHVISGSITMGGFNTTSEAVRQLRDSEFAPGEILTSGLEGVATGAAFGITGGASQAITQPLKGIAKVGGKIAGFGAEAETLYATEELAKMAHGEEGFTNPFEGSVEALEKLGVMKLSSGHLAGSAVKKISRAKEVGAKQVAAETLAGILGRTRTGVRFTKEEEEYIRNTVEGKNLVESLMNMHPERAIEEINGKKKLTAEGEKMRQQLANNYDSFMQNTEIPYDVKAKVAATLGGLIPDAAHMPLEVSSDIIHNPDSSVILKTRDKDGNCIRDYKFDSFSDAEGWREAHEEQFRLNDAVNMWNESSLESRSNMIGSIMETYQVDAKEARQMVDAALKGNMGTSFDNDMFLTIYSAIHNNAYPANEYHPQRNYWEGMKLSPEQRHEAMVAAKDAEERLIGMDEDFAGEVIGAADFADEKLAELASRDDITGEQLQAAISYYNWKSLADGMMDEASKDIDKQVEAANNAVRRNTHPDTGRLIEAVVDGNDCYVTAGHFKLSQDGRITLTDDTGAVIVRDKNTGEIRVVSPEKVLVTAISDPQRLIEANDSMDGLRGQLVKQADDSIELAPGTPDAPQEVGEVFVGADGKQYVVSGIPDEQGNWIWQKIELDVNGEPKGNPQPLDIDEYRKAKSDKIDAANRPQPADESINTADSNAEGQNQAAPVSEKDAQEEIRSDVEDVQQGGILDNAGGEAGAEDGTGADNPPATAMSRIPVDKKNRPVFEQASPEDTMTALTEKYGEEKAQQMIAKIAENTAKAFEELSRKDTSKMTDMAELTAHEDALAEAEQKMKYWQGFIKKEEPQQPVSAVPQQPAPAKPAAEAPKQPVTPQQAAAVKPAAEAPKQPVTPQQPTPAKPAAAPQQPAAPNAAERKVYERQIKKSLGNTFEYARQGGGRVEVTFQRVDHEGKVVSTEQAYDAAGNKVGEPTEKRYDWMQLGKALTEKRLKSVVSVGERLRKIRNVKVGDVPLADVLSEEEQQQLLDAYNRKDKDEIGTLEYDLIEAHRKDLILRGRDVRNDKVEKILSGSGTKEEKLRKIRELYKTFDDTSLENESLYPNTLEEAVAELLGNVPKPGEGTLAYYSYGEGDNKTIGLKDESGYGSRGFSGDTKGFNPWLASNGKGMSLKQFSEALYEQLPEGFKENNTDHDVRNALLSVFGSAEVPSDIPTMVIRRGIVQAENNARRMEEMWIDDAPAFHKVAKDLIDDGSSKQDNTRENTLRDAVIEHLQNNGMTVITDVEQGQKALDAYNERVKLARSKKRAMETASVSRNEEHHHAVISVADGAKVQKNLEKLAEKLEKVSNQRKNFIEEVAKTLKAESRGSNSKYAEYELEDGRTVVIRLGDHNATVLNFDHNDELDGISIVVTSANNQHLKVSDKDKAHIVEYYYNAIRLRKAYGKPLSDIVRALKDVINTGEYKDPTGLAERQEVNADEIKQYKASLEDAKVTNEPIGFHKVEAGEKLDELEKAPTVKRYRAMQLIDGKLYPPMSAKVDGEMREPTEIGVWEQSDERPDLIDKNGKFKLNKGQKGQGDVPAAYNPYFHTSTSGLNDQFTSAYKRPELVVVEVEIPESELTSGYKAEGAKDAVGDTSWHSGPVNGQLPEDRKRTVTLSRYAKVTRIVPDGEVADMIAKQLEGTDIEVPYNVVTPQLRKELESRGVRISATPAGTVTEDINGNPITRRPMFFKTTDGQAYGYTLDGKIYVDPRIANTETPIHEYSHLWAAMKRQTSPEEWNNIKSALLGDKTVAPIMDKVRDEYPELSVEGREDDFVEEILTQFSGKRGAERLREIADEVAKENGGIFGKAEAVRAMQRLKNILNSFWESVAKMFGVKYRNANDVADMIMKDFLNGVNPIEKVKDSAKQAQLDTILKNNPADDVNMPGHTWIRSVEDIKTFKEALEYDGLTADEDVTPDFTADMVKKALEDGVVTVYSSKPIGNGTFVTPSKMEAQNYAGDGKVYSKEVSLDDVAWIDATQGQYAKVPEQAKNHKDIERTLMGVHNISEDKLRKAIKQGGLANPSLAVIDTKNGIHSDFGDISLIPKSSLIDSKTGRNAGTYTGDAYTSTYPHVERMITKQGENNVKRIAKEVAKGDEELEQHLRHNMNDYAEGNASRLHLLYLLQKGIKPDILRERTTHSKEEYDAITKIFGEPQSTLSVDFTDEQGKALVDLMVGLYEKKMRETEKPGSKFYERIKQLNDQRIEEYRKSLTDDNGRLWFAKGDNFIHENWRDEKRRQDAPIDWYATDNEASYKVATEGLSEDYEKWKENDLFGDGDFDEKLFAGWTSDGNKRYVANTVENASRLMNKEADTNSHDEHGLNATRSSLLKRLTTLSDIRKAKHLLKGKEAYNETQKEMSDELFDIISQLSDMQVISDNQFMNIDYAEARLQEAITKRDPIEYLNKEYGYDIAKDSEYASQLMNFIEKAKELPAKYFETKFKRPVGLNEFAIAVVPENTSADVVEALRNVGLDVRTYADSGDEATVNENRRRATMEAVQNRQDIMFQKATDDIKPVGDRTKEEEKSEKSLIQGLDGYTEKDVTDLVAQHFNDLTGDKGLEIVGMKVIGSRAKDSAKEDSDLDVLLQYKGKASEDGLFNLLNDEENRLYIEGIPVDINPITEGKGGTIEQWLKRNEGYSKEAENVPPAKEMSAAERVAETEIGGALVDRLTDMGMDVSTDWAENRRVLKAAEKDNSEAGKLRRFETPDGKTYGFAYKGKVYLDPRKIDAELPIHEYGHIWCGAFRKLNPKGWQDVVNTMKTDTDTWEVVKKLNPKLADEHDIAEEMISKYSGQKGASRLRVELAKMSLRDPSYTGRWGNIFKNISKAIQDFWKQMGDFLHIKYTSPEQVYDQVMKDFAEKVNPQRMVERYLKDRDAEYMKAVEAGDNEKAAEIFNEALRENIGNGITPYLSVDKYFANRELAHAVKTRDKKAVAEVAEKIAPLIPKDAVLVPAPSHTGKATDMLDVANAISEITGVEVADVLVGSERESQYAAKMAGEPISSTEMGIVAQGELPAGKIPVVIDNVVDTGNTAEACIKALGKGIVCTLGDSADHYKHVASLKSAEPVVTNRKGNVVPLSERFEMGGSKYLDKATIRTELGVTSTAPAIQEQEAKVNTQPTDAQKEAGNYQKGHIKLDGYDITIENPKGSTRSGIDAQGNRWETEMHNTYGYIRGTEGVDGDHIDVFLSDDPASGSVFVVDQVNPSTGEFDEHKVMYGFPDMASAEQAYLSNYSKDWKGLGAITPVSREEFKKWVESSHRKTKPFAEYKSVKPQGDVQVGNSESSEYRRGDIFDIVDDNNERLSCEVIGVDNGDILVNVDGYGVMAVEKESLDGYRQRAIATQDNEEVVRQREAEQQEATKVVDQWKKANELLKKNGSNAVSQRATKAVLKALDKAGVKYVVADSKEEKQMLSLYAQMNQNAIAEFARSLRESAEDYRTSNSRYILYNLDDPFGVPMFFQKQSMARWAMKGIKNLAPEGQWKIIDIGAPETKSNEQTVDSDGTRKAAELMPNIQGMVGWHGSGNKFDHFDHRHMGEGEGNQAYGWGTYITEVEGIGRMYATNVKNSQPTDIVTHNGKEINASDITIPGFDVERKVAKMLARAGGYKSIAISSIENDIRLVETAMSRTNEAEDSDYMKQHKRHIEFWKECIESLKNDEWSYRYRGPQSILYKVDIPDDTGENYFDWTANVPKERADAILSALKEKLLADNKYGWSENDASRERLERELDMMRNYFGETFYNRMATLLGNSVAGARTTGKRLASELLHENGYVGIKYPAEYRSGGRPDGAKNYVIFDENDAKITGNIEFMYQNKGRQIYGWSDGKSIHLTKAGLNPNTPIHEYTHLWDRYIQESDPDLWKKVVSAMKKTDMWQEIRENPGYRNIWNDEDRMASEVHSRLSGTQGEEEFLRAAFKKDTPQAIINEVKSVLRKFWNTLLRLFGKQSKTFAGEGESVDAIIRRPLRDLLEGLNPVEELENTGVDDEWVEPMMMTGEPAPELTPEERQYWNRWSAAMKKWRERNAIPADNDGPGEKPKYQQGQTALDYAKVLMQYNKQRALWETAPKLENYRQTRSVKDAVEVARENEKKYPDSTWAKMQRVSAEMQRIRSAMRTQKQYDKSTVKAVTDLAHNLMTMGFGDNLSRGEMERILSSVKNATGAKDIKKQVDNVMNILIDNQLRNLDQRIVKLSSIKELKQTAQGVEAQGRLELKGQKMIQAFREAREGRMPVEKIRERLYEVAERMSNNEGDASMLEQEYEGLMIALQYQENIEGSREEWADLNTEREDAIVNYKTSGRSYQAQQELLESLDQAMMENKIERIGMFGDIIGRLEGNISESIQGAKEFVEREKQRVKRIHELANFDTAGKEMGAMRVDEKGKAIVKGKPANFFLQPLGTFEQMLKQFGGRNANGEGYLYDYFMRNWIDATDKAFTNEIKAKDELDAKARELFGEGIKRWSDLYEISNKEGAQVEVVDQGDKKTLTLTQGNLLYIYMADKMADGRMKLRKMGITEEQVEQIKEHLDPRLIDLADWIQDEYLPSKRIEYNKVHERMFGAPMASIEHYFPIKILGDARVQEQDVANMADQDAVLPSTITGNIIKRRRNALPLDILHTDALSLALEHIEDMERWAATAEWNKDINTLLSYTTFRNKVKNMKTIYGSGDELWNTFADTARMAAGTYRPKAKPGSVDAAISNIAKGVTAAKINFRVYTAFKQILSAPAFLHDVNLGYFVKDGLNPYGSWKWAMENMPVFRKRWQSRQIGDTRLMDDPSDWKLWKTNVVQMATRWGMSPNAWVDGITCAVGARAIYETRYKKYKQIGATDEIARKRALQDAEIGYNLTQQSSEGAFVSKIQKDRTVAANMLSVFRNSSMAYTRQWYDAYRNLRRRMQSGYKEDSIDFMARQIQEQFNLNETEARQAAEAEYARAGRRDVARMLNMMFGVTIAWNLGASLPYLLMGDDDKTKKEMMTDALLKGLVAGPTEGFAGGNIVSDFVSQATNEGVRNTFKDEGSWGAFKKALDNMGDQDVNPWPLFADMERMIGKMKYDGFAAAQDVFNICTQSAVGVNPQTFTDMFNACMDYGAPGWDGTNYKLDGENLQRPKEIALFIMRLMNAPTSSWRNKYIDELGMDVEDAKKLSYEEMAKRYAHYKHWKDVPMLGWLRGEEGRQEKMEKIQKQFDKAVYERIERLTDKELLDNLAQSSSYDERRQYAKLIHSRIGGNGEDAKKAKQDWQKNYQMLMQYDDIKEDEMLSKKKAEAKANGDKKTLGIIKQAEKIIRENGKKKLGKSSQKDAEKMEKIRKWRREALEKVFRGEQGPMDSNEVVRYGTRQNPINPDEIERYE